jgi:hypothetical protein
VADRVTFMHISGIFGSEYFREGKKYIEEIREIKLWKNRNWKNLKYYEENIRSLEISKTKQ